MRIFDEITIISILSASTCAHTTISVRAHHSDSYFHFFCRWEQILGRSFWLARTQDARVRQVQCRGGFYASKFGGLGKQKHFCRFVFIARMSFRAKLNFRLESICQDLRDVYFGFLTTCPVCAIQAAETHALILFVSIFYYFFNRLGHVSGCSFVSASLKDACARPFAIRPRF